MIRSTMQQFMLFLVVCLVLLLLTSASTDQYLANDPTPIQQRLALQPAGMTVSWSTVGPLATAPAIKYGLSPDALTMAATGLTRHYDESSTWFHHVVLDSLQPSTVYYWTVTSLKAATARAGAGAGKAVSNSSVLSFTTAPAVGSAQPFTVAINGDMGLVNEDATLAALTAWSDRIDLFWHVGDLSYADDSILFGMTYESATELWMTRITPVYSARPYMITPGNHDVTCSEVAPFLCPQSQRNMSSYLARYRMPWQESGAVNNMWYSVDYGQVHFVAIDTEVSFPSAPEGPGTYIGAGPFGDQLSWLAADLKKAVANRAQVPWVVVVGHRPYYTSAAGGKQLPAATRALFEPLFLQYGVDAVWWGHVHWYERMYSINNGTVTQRGYDEPTAPVYIVAGAAGNVEGLDKLSGDKAPYTALLDDTHFGFGLLTVQNATHLNWTYYDSATKQVLDSIEIVKTKRRQSLHSVAE